MATKEYQSKTSGSSQKDQRDAAKNIPTVTPDNDNGCAGAPAKKEDSSNKGKGPKGENL